MIDKMLEAGTTFDWISPLWSLYQDSRHSGGAGFTIDVDGGWSLYAVNDLMNEYNIETWGWQLYGDVFIFRLNEAAAPYAQHLMRTCGVPVVGDSGFGRKTEKRRGGRGLLLAVAVVIVIAVLLVMAGG